MPPHCVGGIEAAPRHLEELVQEKRCYFVFEKFISFFLISKIQHFYIVFFSKQNIQVFKWTGHPFCFKIIPEVPYEY